eukprot:486644_1
MHLPLYSDDLRALVVEVGSSTTKVGFAGEEHPSYLKPSCLGEPCDRNTLDWSSAQNTGGCKDNAVVGGVPDKEPHLSPSLRRPGDTHSADLRLHWPVKDGKVCDWEGAEALLRSGVMGMRTGTSPNLSPQPIFMVEKSSITSASRRRYAELLFEEYLAPSVFMSKDASLTCFALGCTSGLVVDIGNTSSSVTPVIDGWSEMQFGVNLSLGGATLQDYLLALLLDRNIDPQPMPLPRMKGLGLELIPSSEWDYSLRLFWKRELAKDLMNTWMHDVDSPQSPMATDPHPTTYILPDGKEITVSEEQTKVSDLLFDTAPLMNLTSKQSSNEWWQSLKGMMERPGLRNMSLSEAMSHVASQVKDTSLLTRVCMGGKGICGVENASKRLTGIVPSISSLPAHCKVLHGRKREWHMIAWLGGSILASLGSFHEMWMSKAEYDEHGAAYVDKKLP